MWGQRESISRTIDTIIERPHILTYLKSVSKCLINAFILYKRTFQTSVELFNSLENLEPNWNFITQKSVREFKFYKEMETNMGYYSNLILMMLQAVVVICFCLQCLAN